MQIKLYSVHAFVWITNNYGVKLLWSLCVCAVDVVSLLCNRSFACKDRASICAKYNVEVADLETENGTMPDKYISHWESWSPWTECSVSCGSKGGIHSRTRTCSGNLTYECYGPDSQAQQCFSSEACPGESSK